MNVAAIAPANANTGRPAPAKRTIAIVAPSAPPDEVPMMWGSAIGFLNSPCMAVPATASAHPTSAAAITLGILTSQMIVHAFGRDIRDPKEMPVGPRAAAQAMLARSAQTSAGIVMNAVLRMSSR